MKKAANPNPLPSTRKLIGYARISPSAQLNDTQVAELRAAGCIRIEQEQVSAASSARPVLAKLLEDLTAGDVLVVVRLDRLARSVGHLLDVIKDLQKRGVHFRSLRDPIDTSTPEATFSLQVLDAVVQLERAVIAERTKSSMKAAKARGKLAGNPGLRERRPDAIRAVSLARERAYLDNLVASAETWLPMVRELRPRQSWDMVVLILNRQGHDWTVERLRRAVHRMVRENLVEPDLLTRSSRRPPEHRLTQVVARIAIADPDLSLRGIAARLDQMHEPPPRGGGRWQASSVRALLDDARRLGFMHAKP